MIAAILVLATLALAFANGANDISKGIATLVGSGVSDHRRAVLWGSSCTVAGAVAAGFLTQALVATFSGKGLLSQPQTSHAFLLAVSSGALGWLVVATRTGLPVSTTHSLAGALLGTALLAGGAGSIVWSAVAFKVALPLLIAPLLALLLLLAILPLLRPFFPALSRYCICVTETQAALADQKQTMVRQSLVLQAPPGADEGCSNAAGTYTALDVLHWLSSGATSFFRGVNDAPKILAVGVGAGAASGMTNTGFYILVAGAMGAGCLIGGWRVTRTLAQKVTRIEPANGFAANLVTSLLVGLASRFALPVSTTHVSSGAIMGVGLSRDGSGLRSRTVRDMLLAWVVTLPVSAAIAALAYQILS